jgi:hypothetical protein
MEETISLYEKESNREQLRTQLPFILKICNGRWFLQPEEIWRLELVQNAGPKANVFLKEWRRRDAERRLLEGALGSGDWHGFPIALRAKDQERAKQYRQRLLYVELRDKIANERKDAHIPRGAKPAPAREFIIHETDELGRAIIQRFISLRSEQSIYRAWVTNKQRSPFFTSFIEGLLYSNWYAMAEHNKKIDLNAQVDIQLLCYLHRADALVSDDLGFLKNAFDELWKPLGKRLYTSAEFVDYLGLLS